MIVWCSIYVTLAVSWGFDDTVFTAAKGKVVADTGKYYSVDFSEYATKQKYIGDYSSKMILKDNCLEAK